MAATMASTIFSRRSLVYVAIFSFWPSGRSYMSVSESSSTGEQCVCEQVSMSRSRGSLVFRFTSAKTDSASERGMRARRQSGMVGTAALKSTASSPV